MPTPAPAPAAPARWVPVDVILDAAARRHGAADDQPEPGPQDGHRYTAFDGIDLPAIRAEAEAGAAARKATAAKVLATRTRNAAEAGAGTGTGGE